MSYQTFISGYPKVDLNYNRGFALVPKTIKAHLELYHAGMKLYI